MTSKVVMGGFFFSAAIFTMISPSILPSRSMRCSTTQEAADFLNVSRPFLIRLLEAGQIPFRKVGTHRRILFGDALRYRQEDDQKRAAIASELAAEAEELGLDY